MNTPAVYKPVKKDLQKLANKPQSYRFECSTCEEARRRKVRRGNKRRPTEQQKEARNEKLKDKTKEKDNRETKQKSKQKAVTRKEIKTGTEV